GSCGRAAALGEPVYVGDAFADPQFEGARDIAREFAIRSSWSQPIFDSRKRLLGTLAIYGQEPGTPGPEQVQLMESATHTAAICVERHRSGLAMQQALTRLDLALRATGLGVWERDLRTDRVWWSPECLRILGVDRPPDLQTWRAMVHPEDLPRLMAAARRGIEHGEELRAEFRVVLEGGGVRWLENVGRVEFDERGEPRRMSGTMQDITERRAAAEALRASEERFQLAMRGANDGLWDWDLRTRDLYLSPRWKSMLGYADDELPNSYATWERLTHPEDIAPTLERVDAAVEGRTGHFDGEFRMLHRDGEWLDILSRGFVVRDAAGTPLRMVGTHVEITARKRAEQALRESEERARRMIEAAIDAVVTIDVEGRIMQWNREAEHMFGRSRDAVLGRPLDEFVVPESQRAAFRRALAAGASSGAVLGQRTQRTAMRADGSQFPVELALVALQHDGRTLFHAFVRDITELRRAERVRAQLESQLRQAQKMEAIGTLAGGIAHDFNNILAVILGTVEMLMQESGRGEEERAGLGAVGQAATRGSMLVHQILTFSRSQQPDLRPLHLDAIVTEVCAMLRSSLPAGVELRASCGGGSSSTILGDTTQLHQCIVNLCTNAAHAYGEGAGAGLVELRVGHQHVHQLTPVGSATMPPGRYVTLAVTDRGVGMAPQVMERMFEPFFSTRPPDQGSGLGLAVVHGVVTGHRGAIAVASSPGHGTTVTVWFPEHDGTPDVVLPRPASAPRGNGQRVLFVDDEPALAELGRRALERLGYRPEVFTDPRAALAAFERDPAAFQLVVTDQNMPELSGLDLAAAIRGRRPELPIVLSSGYVPPDVQSAATELGIDRFVGKPCSSIELARVLQGTLDRGR
ncbi:MAG: PAS domain S-box protein, partial [Planctomycetota bacterium]